MPDAAADGSEQPGDVEKVLPIHKAQLLSYMKLLNVPVGLLINFHEMKLTDGISRLILPGANQ
jgi:GxxExxY protein